MNNKFQQLLQVIDNNKISIINLLITKAYFVNEISLQLQLKQNLVSYHLNILIQNKIIFAIKKGKFKYYYLNLDNPLACNIVDLIKKCST